VLSLLAGIYVVGYVAVATPASDSGESVANALAVLMACGGSAVLSFVFGKATFHMTDHPNWGIDTSEMDDSIRFR